MGKINVEELSIKVETINGKANKAYAIAAISVSLNLAIISAIIAHFAGL